MRHWLALLLLAVPSIADARRADPLKPQGFRQPSERELKACKALQWIDYRRLGVMAAGEMGGIYAPGAAGQAAARPVRFSPPQGRDGEDQHCDRLGRDAGGTDQHLLGDLARYRRQMALRPSGSRRADQAESAGYRPPRARSRGLGRQGARRSLFALEPDYLPRDTPARDGQPSGVCYSYVTSTVRIESAHGVRAMLQCNALDRYRAIANAAMYARSGPLR